MLRIATSHLRRRDRTSFANCYAQHTLQAVAPPKRERRLTTYVIWEIEYPSLAAREKDAAAVEKSAEFTAIQARMRALIDNFERQVWRAAQTTR